ncbi:hypothetical protein H6F43_03705 [Leptolyngbya sp. FACHB-36]|uniref:hypothetical protein n=1 Tax=Leptolyngbya sp. FACHB-36 TaxID=2692808 RepID=UPI001681012C|nr:hypothetical protein [Leptolyngbya sp. FACHB-36]MBD2019287.1 hypothetical protein [Leptolyngbya sp. FACHB-36]
MSKQPDPIIKLQVDMPKSLRSRLKTLSVKLGITMGDLVIKLISETRTLQQLEQEAFREEANQTPDDAVE